MNFIPFIIILTTVITFSSSILMLSIKSHLNQLIVIESELTLENRNFDQVQETAFYYLPGKIKIKRKSNYENQRLNQDHYERSKCNLCYCFSSQEGMDFLIRCFQKLYSSLLTDQEDGKRLAFALKAQYLDLKKNHPEITLIHLSPSEPDLKNLYKKMFQGFQDVPRFENLFFVDEESHHKPLCFRYAKMPLFQIALGEELSSKFIEFEELDFSTAKKKLTKEECVQFLTDHGKSKTEIEALLHLFTFKEPKKRVIHVEACDPKFGLHHQMIKKL